MIERENDTLFVSLNEVVTNYKPKTDIPEHIIEWYVDNLMFLEEGDTVITGSYLEWLLFVGLIIDKFSGDGE